MADTSLSRYLRPEVLMRIARQSLTPRHLVEGTIAGAHRSPFQGFSVEFASHRQYVPGDDLRHLDWHVYYRHDRHVVKQYDMDTNLVCHLMLDVSASMRYGQGDEQKLLYASRLAATLGQLVVERSDRVSLTLFDEEVRRRVEPSNSARQLHDMIEAIDEVKPTSKTRIGAALHDLASRAGRRGIVILLSDLLVDLDDLAAAIQRLRFDRHEVVMMQVIHHDELHFDLPGTVRFVGLEEDEQLLARPDDIRAAYLDALRSHGERLDRICDANRSERVVCETRRSMAELLADYLQRRAAGRRR